VPWAIKSVKSYDRPRPGGGYYYFAPWKIKRIEPMKIYNIIIAASVLGAVTLAAFPADKTAKTAPTPTKKPAVKVVATVGKVTITSDKIDQVMGRLSGQQGSMPLGRQRKMPSRQQVLEQMVTQKLMEAYALTIPCTPKDIEAWKTKTTAELKKRKMGTLEKFMADRKITKDDIGLMVRFEKLEKQAMTVVASAEATAAFIKANPTYFDGTVIQASHILLNCGQGASTAQRTEARKQLDQILADIKAGKTKFADAAKKHSSCQSKENGGDLGLPFTFDKMVPPFSQTAFGLKVGQVSDIVETQFGFHIIKVTKRTPGTGKPGQNAQRIARNILLENFRTKIMA
jgi:peptidyl-prolyl cis-trans isomerase C